MRFYFHVQDGVELLDDEGIELSDMNAVREEAIQSSGELVRGLHGPDFWTGEPWKLWVTDLPSGGGNTLLRLTFSAKQAA